MEKLEEKEMLVEQDAMYIEDNEKLEKLEDMEETIKHVREKILRGVGRVGGNGRERETGKQDDVEEEEDLKENKEMEKKKE